MSGEKTIAVVGGVEAFWNGDVLATTAGSVGDGMVGTGAVVVTALSRGRFVPRFESCVFPPPLAISR